MPAGHKAGRIRILETPSQAHPKGQGLDLTVIAFHTHSLVLSFRIPGQVSVITLTSQAKKLGFCELYKSLAFMKNFNTC